MNIGGLIDDVGPAAGLTGIRGGGMIHALENVELQAQCQSTGSKSARIVEGRL